MLVGLESSKDAFFGILCRRKANLRSRSTDQHGCLHKISKSTHSEMARRREKNGSGFRASNLLAMAST